MNSQAFELIVITPEKDYPEETEWVNRLFSEGLATLHLRKPAWPVEGLLQYIEKIDEQFHKRIMLHGEAGMGQEIIMKGIHYPVAAVPASKPDYCVSCSVHRWQELQEVSDKVDYVFLSPFFDSISKKGYGANIELKAIPDGADKGKVVALGGVHAGNMQEVQALGLKGAATLGAIWQAENPLEAYRQLKKKF